MEIKNLLRIIFRIFGLYTVINLIFNFLPQQFSYLINSKIYFPFDNQENGVSEIWIYLILVVILIIFVFYLLIINPDLIINKLKPEKFLEEQINFEKFNAESLLQIAVLSIGVLILFDALPELINKIFLIAKMKNMNQNLADDISTVGVNYEIITASVKAFLGLLFIIFQNGIGKLLYKQNVK
ncbi:hypothetical protein [Epilithonimonas mollis]|uniref:Uncharacterized protein n=1 Tax=Epilithonimonas mollis TaxID=216903 RepID=A0A1M6TVS4_9FLAO|nr:hypothetical protein [Epilithonimonas mollis]SHK60908.1 hypothetical protein SAMN05444371_2965 [Epilithonimonas mollis]